MLWTQAYSLQAKTSPDHDRSQDLSLLYRNRLKVAALLRKPHTILHTMSAPMKGKVVTIPPRQVIVDGLDDILQVRECKGGKKMQQNKYTRL